MHHPVLLKEVKEILNPKPGEFFIDGTAGGGGHAEMFLKAVGRTGKLLLIDWDLGMRKILESKFANHKNVQIRGGNYSDLPEILKSLKLPKANGLLLDLGFSSIQIEDSGKGFSFSRPEPLIMTYNEQTETLQKFLSRTNVKELESIIRRFGEESFAAKIASAIIQHRKTIRTSEGLGKVIAAAVPGFYASGRIHPATRTFQALRIYLNRELENLEALLGALGGILKPGGRAAIISFHSLEDRIVKNYFRDAEKKGRLKIMTKKPIRPTVEEVQSNPRSRSAKLRVAILL